MFSRLFSLFSKPPSLPTPPPDGAHIIPCTGIDLGPRRMVVTTGFIIEGRLDPKKLETSLSLLIEKKITRAGARLALRNGVYEFHIPYTFNARTPPVVFTAEDHPESYASPSRPSIEHLRRSSTSEPWLCTLPALDEYLRSSSCPSMPDQFLVPNTPLLHVHVSVFDDLTFLGVTSSHILIDALGTGALLHAWTRLLSGEALDDIPGMPWDMEPFKPFTLQPTGKIKIPIMRGWFKLGVFPMISFILRFMWRLWREPKEEVKLVRVPKAFLEERKRTIMDQLEAEGSSEWVGSSDVLMGWWLQTSYAHRSDTTPVHILLPVNLRDQPIYPSASGPELAPLSAPFINNAVSAIAVPPLTPRTLRTSPLGFVAQHFRRAINAWRADPAGIQADLRWRCSYPLKALFPCPPGAEYAVQTSWRAAKFGELDFGGALQLDVVSEKRKARVVGVIPMMTSNKNRPMRGGGAVLMEDENAVWLSVVLSVKDWEAVRKTGVVEFLEV
ncbi:hypothetical protein B0H19DRAFT_1122209 [Mycena capillaripes]|nr:hypothetical protein B0H19DRAFT_1122209 [Mycena capillaripes]